MERKNGLMLVLHRKIFAEALIKAFEKNRGLEAFSIYDYKNLGTMAESRKPVLALVEIPERYGSPALETLDVCDQIKKASPGCKILLMCSEKDKESIYLCTEEKRMGGIDDFVFYDSSMEYLLAKLDALLPAVSGTL